MPLIVACGLQSEARLIAHIGGDMIVIPGGGDSARLEAELDQAARGAPGLILSTGLAGALDPALVAGDLVIDGDADIVARLRQALPDAHAGGITGSDTPIATIAHKRTLHAESAALAVDMESHVAARVARRHGLPFAALRAISDTAKETLPPAALVGMRPDGGVAFGAVLASLARQPAQLPALIRTGINTGRAMRRLGRAYDVLGRLGIARLDLGQLPLEMR
ncbi:phosphorylase family protein [Flavisphingomonas formosensis]|uniref:phosphorylase family protein n=1 Tax=Flavisphingomonas formosensis TaxID=861534 RepID=UPI0012FCE65F|nr:phosphorylase [Sphingomonas formosensis]